MIHDKSEHPGKEEELRMYEENPKLSYCRKELVKQCNFGCKKALKINLFNKNKKCLPSEGFLIKFVRHLIS